MFDQTCGNILVALCLLFLLAWCQHLSRQVEWHERALKELAAALLTVAYKAGQAQQPTVEGEEEEP